MGIAEDTKEWMIYVYILKIRSLKIAFHQGDFILYSNFDQYKYGSQKAAEELGWQKF